MTQSTEPDLLTIAELARKLDLPESTARYYCNRFADHLPSVGEGRRRRYKPEALDTLQIIAATMRRDKNAYAVDLALRNGNCEEHVSAHQPSALPQEAFATSAAFAGQVLTLMENQTRALQEIADAMTAFAERLSFSVPLTSPPGAARQDEDKAPAAVPSENESVLRKEIAALREQIRSSESVHQNDLEQLRKWLTRLGEAVTAKK